MSSAPRPLAPLRLPFDAVLAMPGSKSHANRAIIVACLAKGHTIIENATPCDDVALLVKNLQKMGFDIRYTDKRNGVLSVCGGIPRNQKIKRFITLHCGNAGTTLRFLTALACVVPGSFQITGDKHMQKRPIGDLVKALKDLGADIKDTHGCPPLYVGSGVIEGGTTQVDVSKSSQFLTSLLLIEPALPKDLLIKISGRKVSKPYIALTEKVLEDFKKKPRRYTIEGDHSAAGAFLVLAELTSSRVRFSNLNPLSLQADTKLPQIIKKMRRKGTVTIPCKDIQDQVMNIAVLAAFRNGTTKVTGAANLRYKECDRLAVLTKELKKVGIDIQEHDDGLIICGHAKLKATLLDPHDDHRMVFCFAILGSLHHGIRIKNSDCVRKSYPDFFKDLESLHGSTRPIAIVGMRGVGKSTFGKKLSSELKLKNIDSDRIFVKMHGNIRTFVDQKGFKEFRKEEECIVQQHLQPRSVIALGGGAIESQRTRELLKDEAIVIYLKAKTSEIIDRLKRNKRPPLTNLPLEKEVPLIMKKRIPLYRDVATLSFNESQKVEDAIKSLSSLCSS